MLTTEIIKKLDSNNVSANTEHTKNVIFNLLQNTNSLQRTELIELGGYPDFKSFYAAKATGRISARMTITLAIYFQINPYFIVGADLNQIKISLEDINRFLTKCGFTDNQMTEFHLTEHIREKSYFTRRPHVWSEEPEEIEDEHFVSNESVLEYKIPNNNQIDISFEDMIILLNALQIQSKLGKEDAIKKLELIKNILIKL